MLEMDEAAPSRVVIYGAGGLGRETAVLAEASLAGARIEGFIDDGVEPGVERGGLRVLGGIDWFDSISEPIGVAIGVGDSKTRRRIYRALERHAHVSFPRLIHPMVTISKGTTIGEGAMIHARCAISVDVSIGRCVLLNGAIGVGHDTVIEDFASVMPMTAISGAVVLGEACSVGTQCAIRQGLKIGAEADVWMGSIVMRSVPAGATVCGNPARRI